MKNIIKTPFAFLGAAAILAGAVLTSAGLSGDDPQPELAIGAKAPLADAAMSNVDGTMTVSYTHLTLPTNREV